jgi:hypothetical protein
METVGILLGVGSITALGAAVSGLVLATARTKARPPSMATVARPTIALPSAGSSAPSPRRIADSTTATDVVELRVDPALRAASAEKAAVADAQRTPPTGTGPSKTVVQLKASVAVVSGYEPRQWTLEKEKSYIGRSPDVECFVASLTVSRRHAVIERRADGYYVRDAGSKNGCFCNGVKVDGSQKLKNSDQIEVGEVTLRFQLR